MQASSQYGFSSLYGFLNVSHLNHLKVIYYNATYLHVKANYSRCWISEILLQWYVQTACKSNAHEDVWRIIQNGVTCHCIIFWRNNKYSRCVSIVNLCRIPLIHYKLLRQNETRINCEQFDSNHFFGFQNLGGRFAFCTKPFISLNLRLL